MVRECRSGTWQNLRAPKIHDRKNVVKRNFKPIGKLTINRSYIVTVCKMDDYTSFVCTDLSTLTLRLLVTTPICICKLQFLLVQELNFKKPISFIMMLCYRWFKIYLVKIPFHALLDFFTKFSQQTKRGPEKLTEHLVDYFYCNTMRDGSLSQCSLPALLVCNKYFLLYVPLMNLIGTYCFHVFKRSRYLKSPNVLMVLTTSTTIATCYY